MASNITEPDSQPVEPRRPAELTVAVVLTYISAFVEIVVGVLVIFLRYVPDADDQLRRFVTISGAVIVLIGFLTIAVASGIARGDRNARIVLTVLMGLSIALSVTSVIGDRSDLPVSLVNFLVSAGLVVVLWTGRVRRYFRAKPAESSH